MVPAQDVVHALSSTALTFDETTPALVVGVVFASFAVSLLLVSFRRRDAE